jgi:hypothetical protein
MNTGKRNGSWFAAGGAGTTSRDPLNNNAGAASGAMVDGYEKRHGTEYN